MNKDTFKSYKFKPSDVIKGVNRYFAETKANRYRRVPLEIKNGTVKPGNYYVFRNLVFDVSTPKIKELGYYYVICDPEEVVGVAINWLREEHDIFYTPWMNEPPIKDPDDIDDFCIDDAAKEYEKATRKDRIEELQESRRDLIEALQRRLYEAKRRIVALEQGHAEKSKIVDQQVAKIEGLEEACRRKDHILSEQTKRLNKLVNLRLSILQAYREIFDCSNGDPEGSDEETLQDILTEYKRTLELKNAAEEKTIKYKELAKENDEKAAKYKVRLDNAERQLRWTEEVSSKRLEKYEKLKSELDGMPKLRQKLAEIKDICER